MKSPSQESMNAELQLLRSYVEDAATGPAIVVVTSAEAGDGKSLMAYALAESLARSGRKTALLDASHEDDANPDAPPMKMIEGSVRRDTPVSLTLPDMQQGLTREIIADFFTEVRATYDFMIIDTAALLSSHRAMILAGMADGILLSVRVGRAQTDNDRTMIRVIEQSHGNILGVVAATSGAIGRFQKERNAALALAGKAPSSNALALTAGDPSDALIPGRGPRYRRFVSAMFLATFALAGVVGFEAYQSGGYQRMAAVAPAPAKALLQQIVAKIQRAPK